MNILSKNSHRLFNGPCPSILWDTSDVQNRDYVIGCKDIISGSPSHIEYARSFAGCTIGKYFTDDQYLKYIESKKDCDHFLNSHGFLDHTWSDEEKDFPIAFSILLYENVHQMQHLLQAIYRPQNIYCLHVDAAADQEVHDSVQALTKCFTNVFLSSRLTRVVYGMYPVLEAELNCIRELYKHSVKWKYFINLTGREYPIRTNWELVQILKAYNGSNDILGYKKGYVLFLLLYIKLYYKGCSIIQ